MYISLYLAIKANIHITVNIHITHTLLLQLQERLCNEQLENVQQKTVSNQEVKHEQEIGNGQALNEQEQEVVSYNDNLEEESKQNEGTGIQKQLDPSITVCIRSNIRTLYFAYFML